MMFRLLANKVWTAPAVKKRIHQLLALCLFMATQPVLAEEYAASVDWVLSDLSSSKESNALCKGYYQRPAYLANFPEIESGAIYLAADKVEGDVDSAIALMGDVAIRRDLTLLQSDWASFDSRTSSASLRGNIVLRRPELLMLGQDAYYNTQNQHFSLNAVSYLFYDSEIRGQAERLSSEGEGGVVIERGEFTTCPPDSEHWSIAASEIDLDREEGFGTAKHATFRVQDVPVFYFPYFSFPLDDRRKSGFLYPSIGSSNAGNGLYFSAPYYLNLAPNYDATLTPTYIHGRGLLTDIEGRYLNRWGLSELGVGFIGHDDDYAADSALNDPERWALSFKNTSFLPWSLRSDIHVQAVSDDDYLSDLDRALNINEASHLDRKWRVTYQSPYLQVHSLLHDYQTVDDDILAVDQPYARLPELGLNFNHKPNALRYKAIAEYVNFHRDNDTLSGIDKVNGQRLTWQPGIQYEFEPVWGFLRTGASLHHTDYQLEDVDSSSASHLSRTLPIATVDTGLYFDNESSFLNDAWSQTLEPRLYYVYTPFKDQSDYPDFDSSYRDLSYSGLFRENLFSGGDRIGDNNRLSIGITSRFIESASGDNLGRISLGQMFFFDDRQLALDGEGAGDRKDSAIVGELTMHPYPWLDLTTTSVWDARAGRSEEGLVDLRIHSEDYRWVFNASHRYFENELEQTDISAIVPVNHQISLFGRWMFELADNRTIGTVAGVEYESCCWRVQLFNRSHLTSDEKLDHTFLIRFELKGLGGTTRHSTTSPIIEGYEQRERYLH